MVQLAQQKEPLPSLAPFTFPPETQLIPENEYIDLEVIDLSNIHDLNLNDEEDNVSLQDITERAIRGLSTTGFIALKGHGLTAADLQHQFALGKILLYDVSEEEKVELIASIKEGSWAGYKPQGYFTRPHGGKDVMEHYDLYPFTAIESRLPNIAKPYLSDIRSFIEHNHYHILKKVLYIISKGLGLESEMQVDPDLVMDPFSQDVNGRLWRLHHREDSQDADDILRRSSNDKIEWKHTKDHLRYVLYHPQDEENRERHKRLLLPGHTDLGSVTFLYSQPVAGLQVRMTTGEWKYIRYYKDHIVLSLGDSMEFLTGGILKAAPHRVKEPPEDQRQLDRLGLFYFVPFLGDVPLAPINHPALSKQGSKDIFKEYYDHGGKPMLSDDWLVERSKLIGTKRPTDEKDEARKALYDIAYRYNSA